MKQQYRMMLMNNGNFKLNSKSKDNYRTAMEMLKSENYY